MYLYYMRFLNKITLLSSLCDIHNLLQFNIVKTNNFYNKIAVEHYFINNCNMNVIRIWNVKSIYNWWNQKSSLNNFVMAIDYKINKDEVKIEYFNINHRKDDVENCKNIKNDVLTENEIYELLNSTIIFIENIAKENNKNKIIIDVHNDLEIYNKYYKDFFQLTNRKTSDIPFWLEVERII